MVVLKPILIRSMGSEDGRLERKGLTGYVLGEELGALSASFWCFGIPKGFNEDVMVFTRYDSNVASCGMAYLAVVAKELDVHTWYHSRVFCRISDIDFGFKRQRGRCCIQYS